MLVHSYCQRKLDRFFAINTQSDPLQIVTANPPIVMKYQLLQKKYGFIFNRLQKMERLSIQKLCDLKLCTLNFLLCEGYDLEI